MSAQPTPYFVHPSSIVDDGAQIGDGTKIWHFCHVSSRTTIGRQCSFGQNCFVAPGVEIGNNVRVQNNVSLYDGCIVEDDVFLGPSCVLTNVFNPRAHVSRKDEYRKTVLRRGATVGANATIVCGIELGAYCFIGAGSVVTRSVPAFGQIVGNPGRLMGYRCQCGQKLCGPTLPTGARFVCDVCAASYAALDDGTLSWLNEPGATRP